MSYVRVGMPQGGERGGERGISCHQGHPSHLPPYLLLRLSWDMTQDSGDIRRKEPSFMAEEQGPNSTHTRPVP